MGGSLTPNFQIAWCFLVFQVFSLLTITAICVQCAIANLSFSLLYSVVMLKSTRGVTNFFPNILSVSNLFLFYRIDIIHQNVVWQRNYKRIVS